MGKPRPQAGLGRASHRPSGAEAGGLRLQFQPVWPGAPSPIPAVPSGSGPRGPRSLRVSVLSRRTAIRTRPCAYAGGSGFGDARNGRGGAPVRAPLRPTGSGRGFLAMSVSSSRTSLFPLRRPPGLAYSSSQARGPPSGRRGPRARAPLACHNSLDGSRRGAGISFARLPSHTKGRAGASGRRSHVLAAS